MRFGFRVVKCLYLCNAMAAKHAEQICHPGVVEKIEAPVVFVKIEAQAACGHCRAKSHCGMVESVDKIVEVNTGRAADFSTGQRVDVVLERSLGYRALLMGYMLPFLIMLISLFAMYFLSRNEAISALVAIAMIIPYYALLYHFRDRLRETFHFSVKARSTN